MKGIVSALCYILVFLGLQAAAAIAVPGLWRLVTSSQDVTTVELAVTMVVFSVLTIAVFLLARWAQVSPRWLSERHWLVLVWAVVAALGSAIPSTWLLEQLPELPNLVEDQTDMLLSSYWGYLTVALLAPLAEELVFRGAVLRTLLRAAAGGENAEPTRRQAWTAIAISALLFAVSHLNPAQMPYAFLGGLLLGWMYWRTGSILPGIAFHWANNSVAYILYQVYPDKNMQLIDVFKGSQLHVYMALAFSLLILLPALFQLHVWMRRAQER